MVEKHAIIHDGVVDNVILWDSEASVWTAPEGSDVVLVPDDIFVGIGYLFDGEKFSEPDISDNK